MQSLPVELTLTIFEYLQDDLESLFSCSLVCHEWVHLARQYLFAVMDMTLPPTPLDEPHRLPQSIISLASGASIRVGYIKKLRIEEGYGWSFYPATLQGSVVYQLIAKLPKLQSLQFVNVPIDPDPIEPVDVIVRPAIKSLEIKYGEGTAAYLVTSTIAALQPFSSVETLSIIIEYPQHLLRCTLFQHPQIHRLHGVRIGHLRLDVTEQVFTLLQDLIDIRSSVGSISLRPHMTRWSQAIQFGPMIRDISSKIVSLTLSHWRAHYSLLKSNDACKLIIYMYYQRAPDRDPLVPSFADWEVLSLSQCTSLKSITLIFDERSFMLRPHIHSGESLIHILSHITRDIQIVRIQFGEWAEVCKPTADRILLPEMAPFWGEFDITLSKFDCLKRLEFWFVIQEENVKPAWEEGIKKHLNRYVKKGMVSFSSRYDLKPKNASEQNWISLRM